MTDNVVTLEIKTVMDISDVKANVGVLQSQFNKLKLPAGITDKFNQEINKFSATYEKYQQKMAQGIKTKGDATQTSKYLNEIAKEYDNIVKTYSKASGLDIKSLVNTDELKAVANEIEKVLNQITNVDINRTGFSKIIDDLKVNLKGKDFAGKDGLLNKLFGEYDKGNLEEAKRILQEITDLVDKRAPQQTANGSHKPGTFGQSTYDALKGTTEQVGKLTEASNAIDAAIAKVGPYNQKLATLTKQYDEISNKSVKAFIEAGDAAYKERDAVHGVVEENKNLVNSMANAQQQSQMLTNRIAMYFSLYEIIRKIGDVARSAFQTVKELDASMTETAVVTNFDVGDMWDQLPRYTAAANQLGSTIKDVYDATTLYYQQGLNTSQAMGVAVETLKMARIGGIEAAEATDMMTAALRGFNMQINELSAQRINDVYSKLAAITASNTEELGSAMTRTASIANSAGMEFETTSAFLAQMIETTREAPENLGTAMKTIIARFQEMKKSPEEFIDEEGNVTSINRVDTALRSIGVSLTDARGNFRKLDDVFLETASKWDTLSQGQQRYIATMAAGSRQQSRFIAMMSDYDRTMELVNAANTSAGASQEQFNKTLESMDTKLNKLKNAWDQFAMGLTNNSILKGAIDGLTTGLTVINKFIDAVGKISPAPFANVNKSLLTLVGTLGALRLGGSAFFKHEGLLGGLLTGAGKFFQGESFSSIGQSIKVGIEGQNGEAETAGQHLFQSVKNGFNKEASNTNLGDTIQNNLKQIQLQEQSAAYTKQMDPLMLKLDIDIDNSSADETAKQAARQLLASYQNELDNGQKIDASKMVQDINATLQSGKHAPTDLQVPEASKELDVLKQKQEEAGQAAINLTTRMRQFGMALQGTPLAPFGNLLIKGSTLLSGFSDALKKAGEAAQTAGGGIKGMGVGLKTFWKEMGTMGHLVVLVLALVAAYKALDYVMNHTSRTLKAQANDAADDLSSMKQEVSELNDKLTQISDAEKAFDGLVVGSADFNSKLLETNQLIDELIEKYPLLNNEKYISTDKNGLKSITQAGIDAVKNETNARLATAQSLKTLTENAEKQNKLSEEQKNLQVRQSMQQHANSYNKIRDKNGKALNTEEVQKQIDDYQKQQEVENQKTYETVASALANANTKVVNKDLAANVVADGYEDLIGSIQKGTRKEMGEAFAQLKGYTFEASSEKFTDSNGEDVTEKAKEGGWDDQKVYAYIKAAEQANKQMPKIEAAAKSMDTAFTNAWKDSSEGANNFISDLLSGNTEINRDALQQFTKKNSKMAGKIVANLSKEQIKAFGKSNKEEVAQYLQKLGKDLNDTIIDEQNQLGLMAFKAADVLNIDEKGGITWNNKEQAAQIANQIAQLNAAQRNLLSTAGEQLQTYGIDTMSTFMNGMLDIYDKSSNGATKTIKTEATKAATEIEDIIKNVDLTDPTQALVAFTKISKSSIASVNKFGEEILKTKGFSELLHDSLLDVVSSPSWSEATKNASQFQDSVGNYTAEGIMELSQQVSGVKSLLDEGIISAGGFAAALNFGDGEAGLSNLNSTTLKLLDSLTSVDSMVAKVHNDIANMDFGIDTGEADDYIKENIERVKELVKGGEWGNEELQNRIKSIVGPDAWNKALSDSGFDTKGAINKLMPIVNNLSDGYVGAWNKMADGLALNNGKINDLTKNEQKLFNERQEGIQVNRNDKGGWHLETNGATQAEVIEWLKTKNNVDEKTAEQLLTTFKNYSYNLDKELAFNGFQATVNDKKFYTEEAKKNGGTMFMTSGNIATIAEGSKETGMVMTEKEVSEALAKGAENAEVKYQKIQNTDKKTGELITKWSTLEKQIPKVFGENGNKGWYTTTKNENGQKVIDVSTSESNLKQTGIDDSQIYDMLFNRIQKSLEKNPNAEFEYEGLKLKDVDQIKTADELKAAILEAQSPENKQWQSAAETVGEIVANAITQALTGEDIPDNKPVVGENNNSNDNTYTPTLERSPGASKGSTGNGIGAFFEGSKTTAVLVDGENIEVKDKTKPSESEIKVPEWLKSIGQGIKDWFVPEGAYAATGESTGAKETIDLSQFHSMGLPAPENWNAAVEGLKNVDNGISDLSNNSKKSGENLTDTNNNYKALNDTNKITSQSLEQLKNTSKTSSETMIQDLGKIGPKTSQKLKEELSKVKDFSIPSGEGGEKQKQKTKISAGVQIDDNNITKFKQQLQKADTKIKVRTEDKELEQTTKKAETLKKTGKKGVTIKTTVKKTGIKAAETALTSVQKLAQNTKGAKVDVKSTGDTSGVKKIADTAKKTTAKVPVTSYEAPGARSAINNLKSFASTDVSFGVNVKPGNKKSFSVTVNAKARGMNNHYTTEHFPISSFGSLAAGTKKGRIGPDGKGGLTLTGEEGYEVAWLPSQGKSMILGARGPEMLNLPNDAVVWTHEQSKKIVKRKQFPGGSAAIGAGSAADTDPVPGGSNNKKRGSQDNDTGGSTPKPKKPNGDKPKTKKLIAQWTKWSEKVGKITNWWENISRKVEGAQRIVDKNQKDFEKVLKAVGTTLSSIQGSINKYQKSLETSIKVNQEIYDHYTTRLENFDKNGGSKTKINKYNATSEKASQLKASIDAAGSKGKVKYGGKKISVKTARKKLSKLNETAKKQKKKATAPDGVATVAWEDTAIVKKGGKKKKQNVKRKAAIDFSKIVYFDPETGAYVASTDKINNIAKIKKGKNKGKVNKKEAQAIQKKANEYIDTATQRRNAAEDKINAAREALNKLADDTYNMFNRWEKSLTETYLISKKLEALQKKSDIYDAQKEYITTRTSAGYHIEESFDQLQKVLIDKQNNLVEQLRANVDNIEASFSAYQKSLDFQEYYDNFLIPNSKGINGESETANNDIKAATIVFDLMKEYGLNSVDTFDPGKIKELYKQYAENEYNNETDTAVQKVIDRIAENQENYLDAIQKSYGTLTEVYNTLNEYEEYINEFEESLLKGFEEEINKEIDKQEKLNSALTDAFKDLIDEVKRRLDQRRETEDNARTESDISRKQQRLAVLRADTSGGHASEIKQLEQEIADAQQQYGRTLEDQLLNRLQEQGDEAAKQRERQIKLLEIQRDLAQALGTNLEEVKRLLENPEENYEQIRQLWLTNQGYDEALPEKQEQLERDWLNAWDEYRASGIASEELRKVLGSNELNLPADYQTAVQKGITSIYDLLDAYINKGVPEVEVKTDSDFDLSTAKEKGINAETAYYLARQKDKNITYKDIKNAGYNAKDFKTAGIGADKALEAGFEHNELKKNGYGAVDYKASNIDYDTAKAAFTVDELAKADYEDAIQQKENDKQAKIKDDYEKFKYNHGKNSKKNTSKQKGKLTGEQFKQQVTRGTKLGYSVYQVASELAGTEALSWKTVLTAAKAAGYGAKTIKKWNPNAKKTSNFYKAFVSVFNEKTWKKYAQGGLATTTGPAWLDGTRAKPELVLNAADTKNFIALKDILSSVMNGVNSMTDVSDVQGAPVTYDININVDHLNNDYDVDRVADRVKKIIVQDASYRNVTAVRKFR